MSGEDQRGSFYPSIDQMWEAQFHTHNPSVMHPIGSLRNWYESANKFWNNSDSTYNGVMSGYGKLSQIDIEGSRSFFAKYLSSNHSFTPKRVLDCGAGIGRIAKQYLCSLFETVDVIDQCEKYIQKAKQILKNENIGHFYAKGLQNFVFEERYDCIWVQWVLSHLTDDDAIQFLKKAKQSLKKEGVIVIKENHCEQGFLVDKDDFSVSRSSDLFRKIFRQAGLLIEMEEEQEKWPSQLLDVRMYILKDNNNDI